MPLTQDQEDRKYDLRTELMVMGIEQAKVNIEQMRLNSDKLRSDSRTENRKFVLQALVAAAACVGAGVALANWVNSRAAPPPAVQTAPPQTAPRG